MAQRSCYFQRNQQNSIALGEIMKVKTIRHKTDLNVSGTFNVFRDSGLDFLVFFPTVAV